MTENAKETEMTATLQIITNIEADLGGYTRGWIVPAGTDPTADLEMTATGHIGIPTTEDETQWEQGLRAELASAGYALTGPTARDGAIITAPVVSA